MQAGFEQKENGMKSSIEELMKKVTNPDEKYMNERDLH